MVERHERDRHAWEQEALSLRISDCCSEPQRDKSQPALGLFGLQLKGESSE